MANNYLAYNSKLFPRLITSFGNLSENFNRYHYNILKIHTGHQLKNLSIIRKIDDELKSENLDYHEPNEAINVSKNIYYTLLNNFHASFECFYHNDSTSLNNSIYLLPSLNFEIVQSHNYDSIKNNEYNDTSIEITYDLMVDILDKQVYWDKSRQCLDALDTKTVNICFNKDYFLLNLNSQILNQLLLPPIKILRQKNQRLKSSSSKDKPSLQQLSYIKNVLIDEFPRLLKSKHRYDMYTDNVIFENYWFPKRHYKTIGIWNYGIELIKFRLFIYTQLSNAEMNILNVYENFDEGTVELRWRITGVRYLKALMFWKYINFEDQEWLDGISTFDVDKKGLISKHTMHRMINDDDNIAKEKNLLKKLTINMPLPAAT